MDSPAQLSASKWGETLCCTIEAVELLQGRFREMRCCFIARDEPVGDNFGYALSVFRMDYEQDEASAPVSFKL